jgi:hypothetical protein
MSKTQNYGKFLHNLLKRYSQFKVNTKIGIFNESARLKNPQKMFIFAPTEFK